METSIEKIKQLLEGHASLYASLIKSTIDNSRQYETNVRNTHKLARANDTLDYIKTWEANIGKEVYKTLDRLTYFEKPNPDFLNKTEATPTVFTQELFENLVKHIIEWKIEYYTDELITRSVTSNSTHKLANLEFEWTLECKQENIKLHKELLKFFKK